ncbi:MAG: 1-deoxy-D-xylulose-5-phosphate reductoisomerase [Rhodobacteraceae bacterium]|nr:1-deoxy-D-xylulose-5-phosphate reductoisomerase [Paracoccaceae bacterium]MCY4141798.1 1-deoxy-D-xylulose-5-phosphate reductoisomerase [Paracoccaceae bacterium]
MRKISIFGSTGSVGRSTVSLVQRHKSAYEILALSGCSNVELLAQQARDLRPNFAVIADENRLDELCRALEGSGVSAVGGREALLEAAELPVDWFMSAIVGIAGLEVSLKAAGSARVLALANKESLVCGGFLLKRICAENGCTLIPVDSEHSALFQIFEAVNYDGIENVFLTASGGPFLRSPIEQLASVTPEQAANHPNWNMGTRISIDSASMFNKAMELIELKELFPIEWRKFQVLIHPQSLVHGIVSFVDRGMFAQIGPTDMRHPISVALNWPERREQGLQPVDLTKLGPLEFERPDVSKFPALEQAELVMELGGLAGAVFNGAKERAADLFISRKIRFTEMAEIVGKVLNRHARRVSGKQSQFDLPAVRSADLWARSVFDEIAGTP